MENKKEENVSTIDNLEKRAFKNIYDISDFDKLFRYLKIWWCHYYKRPAKDPLLQQYTFEELIIEFFEQRLFKQGTRFKEIKEEWLLKANNDDEWYKKQEQELGYDIKDAVGTGKDNLKVHDTF